MCNALQQSYHTHTRAPLPARAACPAKVCVLTAPLFSAFCALAAYGLVSECRSTGAGLAAAALSGLPVTAMDRMTVPANFTTENGFCFPKFVAAQVSRATLTCGEGAVLSLSAMGQTACVKQVYTTTQSCFRSAATCPANNIVDAEQLW